MSDGRDDQVDKSQDSVDEESVSESVSETAIDTDAETTPRESDGDTDTNTDTGTETTPAITRRSSVDESTTHGRENPKPATGPREGTDTTVDGPGPVDDRSTGGLDAEDILEYTTGRRSLASHVKLQWGLWTTVSVVILTAILTGVMANFGVDPRFGALVLVVLFLLGMVWVALRYRRWVYQVREDALYLERGVVTHVRTIVPYVRIQHVDTSRGPLERTLGLSTLVVYTAGSRGADVSIPGLTPDEARDLQQRVKELAIEAEGDDAV